MSKKVLYVCLTLLAANFSAGSFAQTLYAGGNYAALDYSEDNASGDASLGAIYGRFGAQFNDILSSEVRLGLGIGDDSFRVFATDVDVELENMAGAYVRAGIPVGQVFYPYAVVGYTRGQLDFSAVGFGSDSESETDISFGVGADFSLGSQWKINVEYMNYLDKNGAEVEGLAVGAAIVF